MGRFSKHVRSILTCPNCQIGDIETIWSLVIGSGSKFRVNVVDSIRGSSNLAIGAPAM